MKSFFKVWLSIALIAIVFGIGILIIIAGSGATWRDIPTYSLAESYDGVNAIDMEIGYGDVKIVTGNEFSIDAENLMDDSMESYVSDGTWTIRQNEDNFHVFGLRFPAKQMLRWNDNLVPRITITIPEDFVAKNFNLNINAGSVTAEAIQAENGDFKVDAGKLEINRLVINGKSQYNVGAGEMRLNDIEVNDISVDCGVGNIEIDGTIKGDNNIKCGIGEVDLNLSGDEEDYSYEVNSGIGNVSINDDRYHNLSNHIIDNEGADNYFYLDCGIGNIIVEFN
jgi:hypothetical protein